MGKINGKLLPVIFFVIGIVFVFVGVGMKYQAQHKKKVCTEKTTAEVVEIKKHVSHHTSSKKKRRTTKTTYRPVFKYTALDGRTYKKEGSVGSNPSHYTVGEQVELMYNPDNPEEFYCPVDESTVGFLHTLFIIMGGVFAGVGAVNFVKMRRVDY